MFAVMIGTLRGRRDLPLYTAHVAEPKACRRQSDEALEARSHVVSWPELPDKDKESINVQCMRRQRFLTHEFSFANPIDIHLEFFDCLVY